MIANEAQCQALPTAHNHSRQLEVSDHSDQFLWMKGILVSLSGYFASRAKRGSQKDFGITCDYYISGKNSDRMDDPTLLLARLIHESDDEPLKPDSI